MVSLSHIHANACISELVPIKTIESKISLCNLYIKLKAADFYTQQSLQIKPISNRNTHSQVVGRLSTNIFNNCVGLSITIASYLSWKSLFPSTKIVGFTAQ